MARLCRWGRRRSWSMERTSRFWTCAKSNFDRPQGLAMPLRFDILNPIPGDNPGGESLEYAPVYDQIKEARREDDDAPQGDWQRARKTADWKLVVQLAGDTIAAKSKDLQLAAWLTEGLLKTETFAGLRAGLELNKALLETFWENLYPQIEDGDLELRASPLEWIGTRL